MLGKILKSIGVGRASRESAKTNELPAPYANEAMNFMYNLLFCDEPSLFNKNKSEQPSYWEKALFSDQDEIKIREIADNENEESRVRALAFNWLRKNHKPVEKGALLGVVVEVPLENGLDVLAAYADGRVRYINQIEKLSVVELGASAEIENLAKALVEASIPVIKKIGPWDESRLPSPARGNIRLSFLVSDGLYFGEGPMHLMQKETMAAPVIHKAIELLQKVVEVSTK